jgi:hypothetical protein
MGLYPPTGDEAVLSDGEFNSLLSDKGMPPLKVRNIEAHREAAAADK